MGKNKIVQSNFLIDTREQMSVDELRIYFSILRYIKKEDTDFKRMTLKVNDICEEWGIAEKGHHKSMMKALNSLAKSVLNTTEIDENGKKANIVMPLISYAKYVEGSGELIIEIHEAMKPYLLQLSQNYTKLDFDELTRLSAKGMRFLEIISKHKWLKSWSTDAEQFKKAMQIQSTKYERVSELERKMIIPCVEELNEKTHYKISYRKEKRGKNAVFIFDIKDNILAKKEIQIDSTGFGEYENVVLSAEELEKLQTEFPEDWERRIDNLSSYMASKGKSYSNHYATIKTWAKKEEEKKTEKYRSQHGVLIDPTKKTIFDDL